MIGLLIFPGFQLLDAAGPIAVFEIAGRLAGRTAAITPLSIAAGPVRSSAGVEMVARGLKGLRGLDTLIVAGGEGTREAVRCAELVSFVAHAARRVRRVASVCSGAYVLAEAGLLDGRRATTHWGRTSHFLATYPKVRLEPDRIFVKDGPIWTSAGISAGIDLALAMVAEDDGDAVARDTARQLVVYHRRAGGQSQFSRLLELKEPAGRFRPLLSWARENLDQPLTVERMAEQAAMSARHFTRAFVAETGMTPSKAVERLRVEAAKARVEGAAEPIEAVALATGFGDPERMRRAFMRAFGQPPQALRRAARTAAAAS
ncbi:MAG: GlxA family transcriptional regulator [Xanthobacteraceae bacterium]|nr:GlxA family transcriptional regulator [Xanthobacteraceae bacterium]